MDVWVPISTDIPKNALTGPVTMHYGCWPSPSGAIGCDAGSGYGFPVASESEVWSHLPVYFRATAERQHLIVRPASAGFAAMGRKYERPLMILLTVVALVLLIACGNVANLVMARNNARAHEIHVRLALGAGRGRIAAQLFAETVLLALAGAGGGVAFAMWGCRLVVSLLPQSAIPLAFDFRPNPIVLSFTGAIAVATALLFSAWGPFAPRAEIRFAVEERAEGDGRTLSSRILVESPGAIAVAADRRRPLPRNGSQLQIDRSRLPDTW